MKHPIDVPALVTGITALGFGVMCLLTFSGGTAFGMPSIGFAMILVVAGGTGLIISQRTPRRR